MDEKFFKGWFGELNNGLDKMNVEACSRLFAGCAERCAGDALKYLRLRSLLRTSRRKEKCKGKDHRIRQGI